MAAFIPDIEKVVPSLNYVYLYSAVPGKRLTNLRASDYLKAERGGGEGSVYVPLVRFLISSGIRKNEIRHLGPFFSFRVH